MRDRFDRSARSRLLISLLAATVLIGAAPIDDPPVADPPAAAPSTAKPANAKDGWRPLFNGRDLEGWTYKETGSELGVDPSGTVKVEDGVIRMDYADWDRFNGRFGHLHHAVPFDRYRIRVVYRFTGNQCTGGPGWAFRNSGIMIHGQDPATMRKDQDFPVSIEVQLLGGPGSGKRPTANLCTPGTNVEMNGKLHTGHCKNSESPTFHGDQWVTAEVEVLGNDSIVHYVNGEEVMRYERPQLDPRDPDASSLMQQRNGEVMLDRGWISIQGESHPVEFKSIELKALPVTGEASGKESAKKP